jgi:hypothetical protein
LKCWCCGGSNGPFIEVSGCKRLNSIAICIPHGCAAAFEFEWDRAVEESGLDPMEGVLWAEKDSLEETGHTEKA